MLQMQTSGINGSRGTMAAFPGAAQHRVHPPGPGSKAKDEGSPRTSRQVLDSTRSSGEANGGGNFRVVIRVRPPLDRELSSPVWQNVVTVSSETQVCLHEVIPDGSTDQAGGGSLQVVNSHFFTFDCVYDQDTSQPDVYARAARASVLSTLQGYNATILAYGPTGTGKTYTMEGQHAGGDRASFGIIPRSMEEIFTHIRDCKGPQDRFLVRASYLQIYNEVVSDLLKPERNHLVIREDRRRGVFVEGLSEWLCRSPSEVHMLMVRGSAARATAQTGANDASSRSHAVFLIVVEQSEVLPDDRPTSTGAAAARDPYDSTDNGSVAHCIRVGRLNLVDLAGSERPRLTGATGQRLEETKKINQSLSALGNVIATLTERPARQHVPYRDSKLTRLLEDSLGGNCRTTMMAMVSPAAEAFAETLSTLKFAYRAKAVTNTPHVNEDVDQRTLIRRYEAELRRLRAELRECGVDKQQLLEMEEGRRRAEEDRQAAVSALQERALVLEREKAQKEQLEQRIQELSGQLLAGGRQDRAPSEPSERLVELPDREQQQQQQQPTTEDDHAQVGRYKQLLFKQRDIMIALTQRLHERDEMIVGLQDEIDARDKRLAALQGPLVPQGSKEHFGGGVWQDRRYPAEGSTFDRPVRLLTADEKITELSAELHSRTQESHRLRLELEALQGALAQAQQMKQEAAAGTCDSTTRSAAAQPVPPSVCSSTTRPAAAPAGTTPSPMPGASAGALQFPARSIGGDATVHGMPEESRHSLSPEAMQQASLTPEGVRRGVTPRAECRGRRSPSQESGRQLGRSRALLAEATGAKRRAHSLGSASIPSLGSTVASSSDPIVGSARQRPGDASTSCSTAGSSGSGGRSSADLHANSEASTEEAAPLSTPLLAQAGPILKPWLIGRSGGGSHQDVVTPTNATPGKGLVQKAAAATSCSRFSELMSKFAVPSTPGSLRRSASCTGVPDGSAGVTVGSGLSTGRGPVRAAPLHGGTTAAAARSALGEAKPPWWQSGGEAAAPLGATATGAGGAASSSAQALREEAQRSVDALLARRRAELQRNMARA